MRGSPALLLVAGAGGVAVTLGLLLSIALLAGHRTQAQTPRPLLVVDLVSWPAPAAVPIPVPAPAEQPPRPAPPDAASPPPPRKAPEEPPAPVVRRAVAALEPAPPPPEERREEVVEREVKRPPLEVPPAPASAPAQHSPQPVPVFRLTRTPRYLHRAQAVYPEAMRGLGLGGVVRLEALIDKAGRVREVRILKSAGEAFDEAARQAILGSTFSPAQVEGEAVAVLWRLTVKFSLR